MTFCYPGSDEPVLKNISFKAKHGQTTAFIGVTGSGKSTLVNLLIRFYDVTAGRILVDGVDIRDMKRSDLRNKIGYIPQKNMLFSGTVKSNLQYADSSSTFDNLQRAARIAQAEEFIINDAGWIRRARRPGRIEFIGRAETAPVDCARPGEKRPHLHLRR